MFTAKIKYVCGINGDYIEVIIFENGTKVFTDEYAYGYNASYNRERAKIAEKDHNDAIKYNWENKSYYCLKPYIGDILVELLGKYGLTKEDAEYSGRYVFSDREAAPEEVKDIVLRLYKEL